MILLYWWGTINNLVLKRGTSFQWGNLSTSNESCDALLQNPLQYQIYSVILPQQLMAFSPGYYLFNHSYHNLFVSAYVHLLKDHLSTF